MNNEGVPPGFEDGGDDSAPDIEGRSTSGLSLVNLDEPGSGGIVSARGTGDGLVLRLDGQVRLHDLKKAVSAFMESRSEFISGNTVALEWSGRLPDEVFIEEFTDFLHDQFRINVSGSALKGIRPKMSGSRSIGSADSPGGGGSEKPLSLFDGVETIHADSGSEGSLATDVDASALFDDADARIMLATLRSGQKIETDHSLVICGDVNFGAEVVAGGDVIVLGTLRGVAHAGAYDETGGGRFIFSLDLRPTQLRIGSVISRGGPDQSSKKPGTAGAEIARVEGDIVVVEPYKARARNIRVAGK